ncbi:EamA-like transporter family protein [Desulfuromusa kysingii]|uniref:EamA-like transporter family protein n=1 Tax=Desulfuromusa kysingii TaxID=37625 RepID=A0A1H3VVU4_9BACT|nr:DMT family transporter [Desulfuromusa kysingii]SDZ78975.1 EamA-like transporter family protein [Desulfuromusa kysingii]
MQNNLHLRGVLYAFFGVLVLSFDSLLVRLAETPSITILFWRGLFIGISLTAFTVVKTKHSPLKVLNTNRYPYLFAGLFFALAGFGFVFSVQNTTVANTVVILSIAPFFSALISYLLNKEVIKRYTFIAMTAMVLGTLIIVSASVGSGHLLGDMLAVLTAAAMGTAQAYLRRHQKLQRITIIMVSGYLMALFALPFANLSPEPDKLVVLALMGLVQMPLAMVLFSTATCFISAAEASMFMIVETVFGPLLVFIFLGETIPFNTIYGGSVIIAALATNTWLAARVKAPPAE